MPHRENSRIVPEWWNHVFNYVWERVKEHSEIVIEAELDGWPENNFQQISMQRHEEVLHYVIDRMENLLNYDTYLFISTKLGAPNCR